MYISLKNNMYVILQSYERRSKVVKQGKEAKRWAEVTPDMMSDEELDEENKLYIRHQQSYRSTTLNSFIEKLDMRVEAGVKGIHPRIPRQLGLPREKCPPKSVKDWAKKSQISINIDQQEETVELPGTELLSEENEPRFAENLFGNSSDFSDSSDILSQYKQ